MVGNQTTTLRQVMTQPARTVPPDWPVCKVAQTLAVSRIGCVLVVDDGALVGVFTERDLVRMFTTRLHPPLDEPVSEHMSRYPLTLDPDATIAAGARFMRENMIRHLPLVERGRLVGVVSVRDLSPAG